MKRASLVLLIAGLAVAGCGSSRAVPSPPVHHHAHAAIRAARDSNFGLFEIFPARPAEKTCAIPRGGLIVASIKGLCRTSVAYPVTYGRYREALVRFRERWSRGHSSSWTVIVELPAEKVVATRLGGETSPQMRYAAEDMTHGISTALKS